MDDKATQTPPIDPVPEQSAPQSTARQQVIEVLTNAKNVLVTVSTNPSVDELASALGLTFLLAKLDKHTTAVFSGAIPPAMEFLDPKKVFENNVDSLRDFIIALDKEKADKLRYKVEEDVVKIFITPYKTTLKKDDFDFSQGDFNVDVVVALGARKRDDLDKAITAHGRILHDATVITINTVTPSSLGSIDWTDPQASSIAEMLMSASESFGSGLLDEQISTAYLTGIVAATNRFSNEKTTPKIMTMAAQLMAAGANQQLIATNLRREGMITENVRNSKPDQSTQDDGELSLRHDPKAGKQNTKNTSTEKNAGQSQKPATPTTPASEQKSEQPKPPAVAATGEDTSPEEIIPAAQPKTEPVAPPVEPEPPVQKLPPLPEPSTHQMAPLSGAPEAAVPKTEPIVPEKSHESLDKPIFGGTLNATTADAAETRAEQESRESAENNISLSHDSPSAQQQNAEEAIEAARQAVSNITSQAPFDPANNPTAASGSMPLPVNEGEVASAALHPVEPSVMDRQVGSSVPTQPAPLPEPSPIDSFMQPHTNGVNPPEQQVTQPEAAVASAPLSAPSAPAGMPPLPPLPPLPGADASGMPPLPPLPGQPQDPATNFQPQTSPDFMQGVSQSQNQWTEAGEDIKTQQAQKEATRQAKIDEMGAQYDSAVDRNRELQGLPPINNDHSTFPLPPTP